MDSRKGIQGEFERCLNIYSEVMQKGKYSLITRKEIEYCIRIFEEREEYEKCLDLLNYLRSKR